MSQSKARGRLDSDVAEINSAQDRNGSITVTIPKDAVRDLGIDAGDGILITGSEGDRALELLPTDGLHE
jgi:hypothetical protein